MYYYEKFCKYLLVLAMLYPKSAGLKVVLGIPGFFMS